MRVVLSLLFLFFFCVAVAHATTRTEDWNCANADPISCDFVWVDDPFAGTGDLELNTNLVRTEVAGTVADDPRLNVDLQTATQTATLVAAVGQPSSGSNFAGPALRMNAAAIADFCSCELLVNSVAQEFIRASQSLAGTVTQTSCGIAYTAGASATVKAEMAAGSQNLLCTYDPGGANEQTCSRTCTAAETNFVGVSLNQSSGGTLGQVTFDDFSVVTPDLTVGGQVFQW